MKGSTGQQRWSGAERAGSAAGPPDARADPRWGLAARGALVEAGGPPIGALWSEREHVWADIAPKLYAAAAAAQWDPATAVDWTAAIDAVPPEIELAVVQVMTYLVENEQAALIVPARLLSQLHPHYREVMQLLATQAADEARHMEVFTRRGLLSGGPLGTSSAGGRASLGDPAERAGLHHGVVPAVGSRRGDLPGPAPLPAHPRPGPGHRRRDQARAAR